MSADLFAAFGQDPEPAQSSVGNSKVGRSQTNSSIPNQRQIDDGFFSSLSGDNQQTQSIPATSVPLPTSRQPPGFEFFNLPRQDNSDVLFDAETDKPAQDTDDDWGDFEAPESESTPETNQREHPSETILHRPPPPTIQHHAAQIDLLDSLSLEDPAPATQRSHISPNKPSTYSKTPQEPTWDDDSFGDWGEFTDAASKPPPSQLQHTTKPAPRPKKPTPSKKINLAPQEPKWDDEYEDWGDFSDGPAPKPKPVSVSSKQNTISKPKLSAPSPSPSPDPRSFTSSTPASPPTVRPTNIPPPSVLLSLLVEILANLQKEALQAQPRTTPTTKKEEAASKITSTLATAARIIAGRSLRWKRDTILSQSMRIGPAGKSGGMKLSTVNKHEDVKESQDAVEVLTLWRERSALFNAVVQGVGQKAVPVVADPGALKVVLAKGEDGAIRASHSCALCALKRDERVLRIDEGGVNDSFGEWWTEHWGHTDCRVFWERNKELLLQR
ncbi:hypothetical protein N7478_003439 [Penicillium angulare]|uniref:uncharacterized protein n=1 Tax=Penicillium angulare TaxID=116970 RepID=UPI00254263A1|nr:uncharacterized protein N7478_003439 [Penicillium angulare]KAJ5287753.1 hypothetical protein N7478_003439 [Penicillium angulare]